MLYVRNFIYGIFMGIFEIVPGISGGTLAVMLNIYDKLIYAISHLKEDFKNNFKYLINIVLGMGTGIYFFSYAISFLNKHYPIETNFFLMGLIAGILPRIFKNSIVGKLKIVNLLVFLVTLGFMMFILFFSIRNDAANSIVSFQILTSLNLVQFFKFVLVGALASFCLILPGCSGSMIMLVFGIYPSVMEAIKNFNFLILFPVAVGILFGLIFGSKIIYFCFVNFTKATYCAILGLVLGSIFTPLASVIKLLLKFYDNSSVVVNNFKFLMFMHAFISLLVLIVGIIFSYRFSNSDANLNRQTVKNQLT